MENLKALKDELFQLLRDKAFKRVSVTLSSGKKSEYYLDGRVVTLSPRGAYLAAELILELVKEEPISAIGGPTLGADPLAGAIAVLSSAKGKPINTFIVRKEPKRHGLSLNIEGPALKKGTKAVIIDDVATSGGSLAKAIDILKLEGVTVEKAIVLVDRKEGAQEALKAKGCSLVSLFTIDQFLNS
jgi:orotate phosphoribosyltransferase